MNLERQKPRCINVGEDVFAAEHLYLSFHKGDFMAVKIFFCYAHEDAGMASKLRKHLRPLERNGLVTLWFDGDIRAGMEWDAEIRHQLSQAQIVLLLVSAAFMDSDYCYSVEMQQALVKHARGEASVVPVVLRDVFWRVAPFEKLQALPKEAKAISSWTPQDKGFANVAKGIHELALQWQAYNQSNQPEEKKQLLIMLTRLVEAAKVQIQPEGRALATAGTLQQLGSHIPRGVTLGDLVAGWSVLARARQEDEQAVIARRKTCTELASIASQVTSEQGRLSGAVRAWQAWQDVFKESLDPRQTTMALTFARELTELQAAIHLTSRAEADQ